MQGVNRSLCAAPVCLKYTNHCNVLLLCEVPPTLNFLVMSQKNIFISYSHKDSDWKDRFIQHLRVLMYDGGIDPWDDDRIGAGQLWEKEIDSALDDANAAVLLISSGFLTSEFIRERELPRLLKRNESGRLPIMPVILKPCAWRQVPWLSKFQARPKGGQPISEGSDSAVDSNFSELAVEVQTMVSAKPPSWETTNTPDQHPAELAQAIVDPVGNQKWDGPIPVKRFSPATQPQCAIGAPLILHNQLRNGIYFMDLQLPGQLLHSRGRQAQVAIRFQFLNGPMLVANAQEMQYRDRAGFVYTYCPRFSVATDGYDLSQLQFSIPYYAFNLMPTGMRTSYQISAYGEVYVDETWIGRGGATLFPVNW